MGKNFPVIKTLKQRPDLVSATTALIEKSFGYQSPHRFAVDFAPLIHSSNHENCFILIDENENVIAHLGSRPASLSVFDTLHSVVMLGGIAVDEACRGKGYFNQLMRHVLSEKEDECAFFLLWSDQEKLYQKFGFEFCGPQFQRPPLPETNKNSWTKTKLKDLTASEKDDLKKLYENIFQKYHHTLQRSETDWKILEEVTSANLFIRKENGKISSYFFRDKGQDLEGIVYEYAGCPDLSQQLKSIEGLGTSWSAYPASEDSLAQYQFMLTPANHEHFEKFLYFYTQQRILLKKINRITRETFIEFNGETLSLELVELLRGVLGPGSFTELGELKPIFISGLDSI